MTEVLKKYTKANTFITPVIGVDDNITPYSYNDWFKRHTGIVPGQEQEQYNTYLKDWYKAKSLEDATYKANLKRDYIQLVKQLTIAFQSEADKIWGTDVDFNNELEIEQAIPFYVKKLKEIAIYLINKREAVKKAKLKYNMVGATNALERIFYEYLLKAFTKRRFPGNEYITNVTDLSVLNNLPELSACIGNFQIQVEELYDDTHYFDKDPQIPVSAYYDITSPVLTSYWDTHFDITYDQLEWLYGTGFTQLCADNPLLWTVDGIIAQYQNGVPLSALQNLSNEDILNDYTRIALSKKYLGETQYILSGGYYSLCSYTHDYAFTEGNNWFYWPHYKNDVDIDNTQLYTPIPLSSTTLVSAGAFAADDYTKSDTLFLIRDNRVSGAWLKQNTYDTIEAEMTARLIPGEYAFLFPYPGYGLTGEYLDWTGRSLDGTDLTYTYLDVELQQAIQKAYWNTFTDSISTLCAISIHDLTLIDSGAYSNTNYRNSDQLIHTKKEDFSTQFSLDSAFTNTREYAWLYKMEKTDIPIADGENKIYWPFLRINTEIPVVATSAQCAPMYLSSVNVYRDMPSARAGNTISTSDKIIKIDGYSGKYIEGAYLSGSPLIKPFMQTGAYIRYDTYCGTIQPSINFVTYAGDSTTFIIVSAITPYIDANDVFKYYDHQQDCEYLKQDLISLYKNKQNIGDTSKNYKQWLNCNCKSIVNSPFGHRGNVYNDFDHMCDYIISRTNNIGYDDLATWKDSLGHDYKNSNEFGWYQLTGGPDIDAGWGPGRWVTYNGSPFILSGNLMYTYYRSNMGRSTAPNLNEENAPYYIARYTYSNIPSSVQHQWMQMIYNENEQEWEPTGYISPLVLNSGEYFIYDHKDTNVFVLSTIRLISETLGAPVTTPYFSFESFTNQTINFILNIPLSGWNYSTHQYDITSAGGRPFWAKASDLRDVLTLQKGVDIYSGNPVLIDKYNFITQPEFSDITINLDDRIEYIRPENVSAIVWKQPLVFNVYNPSKQWCKLVIDETQTNNLSDIINNNINKLIVSGVHTPSNLVLDFVPYSPMEVNYYCVQDELIWSQPIINITLGQPPSSGIWNSILSATLILPDAPYANLTNRHYPTIATVPYINNFYSDRDVGGYFVASKLGVGTAFSRNFKNILDTSRIINTENRGLSAVFRDINIYNIDKGFTKTDQIEMVSSISTDSTWMKASVVEGRKAGLPVNVSKTQVFIPYQTRQETLQYNDNGVVRQDDALDPWYGDMDDIWKNNIDWPPNWRGLYPIEQWYEKHTVSNSCTG